MNVNNTRNTLNTHPRGGRDQFSAKGVQPRSDFHPFPDQSNWVTSTVGLRYKAYSCVKKQNKNTICPVSKDGLWESLTFVRSPLLSNQTVGQRLGLG